MHPDATPAHVSLRKIPVVAVEVGSRVVAVERNVMYRPPGLIAAEVLLAFACAAVVATEISCVEGVQPDATPAHVSRTKTSATPLVSPDTRFEAEEINVT